MVFKSQWYMRGKNKNWKLSNELCEVFRRLELNANISLQTCLPVLACWCLADKILTIVTIFELVLLYKPKNWKNLLLTWWSMKSSIVDVMAIHSVGPQILQSEPKGWSNIKCYPKSYAAVMAKMALSLNCSIYTDWTEWWHSENKQWHGMTKLVTKLGKE